MVSFKVLVSIAVLIACATAQPSPAAPEMSPPVLEGSAIAEASKIEEKTDESPRDKKHIVYDAFAYSYPAVPLVSSYSYQYHRAYPTYPTYPYAYSAGYYPYVYGGPTYFL